MEQLALDFGKQEEERTSEGIGIFWKSRGGAHITPLAFTFWRGKFL